MRSMTRMTPPSATRTMVAIPTPPPSLVERARGSDGGSGLPTSLQATARTIRELPIIRRGFDTSWRGSLTAH